MGLTRLPPLAPIVSPRPPDVRFFAASIISPRTAERMGRHRAAARKS